MNRGKLTKPTPRRLNGCVFRNIHLNKPSLLTSSIYHVRQLFLPHPLPCPSSMNGVVDMIGYRQALNLSYNSLEYSGNDTDLEESSCEVEDDVKTSAMLVSLMCTCYYRYLRILQGLILSLFAVGSFFGSLLAGVLSDFAGRKPGLIVGGVLVACGGVLHAAAVNLW